MSFMFKWIYYLVLFQLLRPYFSFVESNVFAVRVNEPPSQFVMCVSIVQWRVAIGAYLCSLGPNKSLNTRNRRYSAGFNIYNNGLYYLSFILCCIFFPFALFICSLSETFPFLNSLSPLFFYLRDLKYICKVSLIFSRITVFFMHSFLFSITKKPGLILKLLNSYVKRFLYFLMLSLSCESFFYSFYLHYMLMQCGDVEPNPGPHTASLKNLSICHWNLNSIPAHNFVKINLLEAFIHTNNHDVIFLSETYLDSSVDSSDQNLRIEGYNLVRCDHPSDLKQGGVCVYFKEHLNLIVRNDLCKLRECLVCEIRSDNNKKSFVTGLYRSPSQTVEQFEEFKINFSAILSSIHNENPFVSVVLGDFNARNSIWWTDDIDNYWGTDIDAIASYQGYTQLIDSPTHILSRSSSCIDLIFTSQPNLILESGVNPTLYEACHHQIIYAKINFQIHFPVPFQRKVWDYSKADITLIRRSLKAINWQEIFRFSDVNRQVASLNSIILNVFENFTPVRMITCNDKKPPWYNNHIATAIRKKNRALKNYNRRGQNATDFETLNLVTSNCSKLIQESKEKYLTKVGNKLNDPLLAPKAYWSLLNGSLGKQKMPQIPPLFEDGTFVTDIQYKADLFNKFFAKQCNINDTGSILPPFDSITNACINNFVVNPAHISRIIKRLNIYKAHGWDGISVRMIKMCEEELITPLHLIFSNCIRTSTYPDIWKKANVVPIHKKLSKQFIKNYRPISLLPIFSKIFEKLIFDALYQYFSDNSLFCPQQSGFRVGDSCICQLLSISHDIFSAFDSCPSLEVRSVYLDISKAFDKVWHEGLLFKMKQYGVSGNLLTLIKSFLSNRQQRVVLNGQSSSWEPMHAGVPQGSVLGPLFFLIYINNLPDGLNSNVKIFADDTSIFRLLTIPNLLQTP